MERSVDSKAEGRQIGMAGVSIGVDDLSANEEIVGEPVVDLCAD